MESIVSSEEIGEREGCDTASVTLAHSDVLSITSHTTGDDTKHGDKLPTTPQGGGEVFTH